ncbi:transposase [Corallococcus sp. AB038B]|uniref:transposase n=1 Tax=Corallococcus sp. AB038B TaxID=2316718 RepID=UPI001F2054FF|nr:transposase [Corallococcus sp. AB038B]
MRLPGGLIPARQYAPSCERHAGLERRCRYGARGALALERLSRAEDGRVAYRMKRPLPSGTTHLLFTRLELLRQCPLRLSRPRLLHHAPTAPCPGIC